MTELEELQRLRLLVEQQKLELEKQQVKIEKQQEELEKKDEIIRKKEIQIVSASKKGVWKYYHFHGILSIRYFSTHFFLFCFRRTSSGSWSDHGKYLSNISGAFSWAYPSSGSSVRR